MCTLSSHFFIQVDLSRLKVTKSPLNKDLLNNYIGGRGLSSRMIFDNVPANADPCGPENILVFSAGPLTGTHVPSSGRLVIGARSPLTGILGDSNVGGMLGPRLRYAGYHMIVIRGRAKTPVYLVLSEEGAEIRDAKDVWGFGTRYTDEFIRKEVGDKDLSIACIGPAGEKLVRFACIISDRHNAAGRTGMGCVMGSKNLKAIAIRGKENLEIYDKELLDELIKQFMLVLKEDPRTSIVPKYGTSIFTEMINELGALPTKNCQKGVFDQINKITAEAFKTNYRIIPCGCFKCPYQCDRVIQLPDRTISAPEYVAIFSFGSRCGNAEIKSIVEGNELCNDVGLDAYSTGAAISFAMECFERGILNEKDTDGVKLAFGNADAIITFIKKIAYREGLGNILAEGVKRASQQIGKGAEKYALHIKGLEVIDIDPRVYMAYGLGYCVASRGGDHLRHLCIERYWPPSFTLEMFGSEEAADMFNGVKGKGRMIKFHEDFCALIDSLGVCKLAYMYWASSMRYSLRKLECLMKMYSAVTGINVPKNSLLKAAERIVNLERLVNAKFGVSKYDFTLPYRFINEPLPDGPHAGKRFEHLPELLQEYCEARGWSLETMMPTSEKLKELEIEYC